MSHRVGMGVEAKWLHGIYNCIRGEGSCCQSPKGRVGLGLQRQSVWGAPPLIYAHMAKSWLTSFRCHFSLLPYSSASPWTLQQNYSAVSKNQLSQQLLRKVLLLNTWRRELFGCRSEFFFHTSSSWTACVLHVLCWIQLEKPTVRLLMGGRPLSNSFLLYYMVTNIPNDRCLPIYICRSAAFKASPYRRLLQFLCGAMFTFSKAVDSTSVEHVHLGSWDFNP